MLFIRNMITLSGKPVVEKLHENTRARVQAFAKRHGRTPRLAVILVGDDPASVIYTRKKGEKAIELGMEHESIVLPSTAPASEVRAICQRLNDDPNVDGILIQRPLPRSFNEEEVLNWVHPDKDVDAFHPISTGKLVLGLPSFAPCTPAGVMEMLKFYGIDPAGKIACVIGRSSIVGKPMGALLLQANATVFQCHSKTPNLPSIARQADILVAAVGKPGFVTPEFIKPGAVVVDVGVNRLANGKVVGDVAFDAVAPHCSAITPVPGGVGLTTIAILLQNTVLSAELRAKR